MTRLLLILQSLLIGASPFAAPMTCEEGAATAIVFKMKTVGWSKKKDSDGHYIAYVDCSKIHESDLKKKYDELLVKCKSRVLPNGKKGNIAISLICENFSQDDESYCKASDAEWKPSEVPSLKDFLLEQTRFGDTNSCQSKMFSARIANTVSSFGNNSYQESCASLASAVEASNHSNSSCDIAPAGKEQDQPVVSHAPAQNNCEIPDASGNCPGFHPPSPPKPQTGFVQLNAPRPKVHKKSGAMENTTGRAAIRQ